MTIYQPLIDPICNLAVEAGEIIMAYYRSGEAQTQMKEDNSPVTDADLAAHHKIVGVLQALTPNIPIVSEENGVHPDISGHVHFWLVDPLDGTKSFIRKTGEFTVNIALIENGTPIFGVIYIPAQGRLFYGSEKYGAFKQEPMDAPRKINARIPPEDGLAAVVSFSHLSPETTAFLEAHNITSRVSASSSLKFCLVAEGKADIYPRFGRTMEWDTAAGHAIVKAAGGRVENTDGTAFTYGKDGFANPGFVAYGKPPVMANVES